MPASGKIGNKGGGRKPLAIEKGILTYYQELMPEAFRFAQEMLKSKNKRDKKWAMDWLKGAYAKMLPQQITGESGGAIEIKLVRYDNKPIPTSPLPTSTS